MSENCASCEHLPPITRTGSWGRASKCPVCKQSLWTTPDCITYRVVSCQDALPILSRKVLLGGLLVTAIGLLIGVGAVAFRAEGEKAASPPTPIAAKPEVATQPQPAVQTKPAAADETAPSVPVVALPKQTPPTLVTKVPAKSDEKAKEVALLILLLQLSSIPEVDLERGYANKDEHQLAAMANQIVSECNADKDAFVRRLMKERRDLQGLPFLMGTDCILERRQAYALQRRSSEIRKELHDLQASRVRTTAESDSAEESEGNLFWRRHTADERGIPALHQILMSNAYTYRLGMVAYLKPVNGKNATQVLANRALFDTDPQVRQLALEGLRNRPKEEYRQLFQQGLRYPWNSVVRHAAMAIVELKMHEMKHELVALLDAPLPAEPFTVKEQGEGGEKIMVRELVRINHHRNCMLCHPPLSTAKDEVVLADTPIGPVPSASQPLPGTESDTDSGGAYSPRGDARETLVRADITYLRQDFSMMLHVEKSGKWPAMQRFDFLVRTRQLTASEQRGFVPLGGSKYEYKQILCDALTAMTGKTAGPTAQAWRRVLAAETSEKPKKAH